jgi:O-acetylserine/cysteine efflux transporter
MEKTTRQDCLKSRNVPLLIVVVLLWGSNYSLVKMGLGFVSPSTLLLERFLISLAVLFPLFLVLRKKLPRDVGTLAKLAIYGVLYTSVNAAQLVGMVGESSGISAVITYTQPLFILGMAAPFLNERITINKILGAVIGFTGVAILLINQMNSFTLESSLVLLLTAFLWAISVVFYKKFLSLADPFIAVFLQMIIGSVLFIALDLGIGSLIFPTNTEYVAIVLYSSIAGLAIANLLWLRLLREEEATTLSSSVLLVPAVALLFGLGLLGENLGFESLLGSALTLGGVFLANLSRNRSHASA